MIMKQVTLYQTLYDACMDDQIVYNSMANRGVAIQSMIVTVCGQGWCCGFKLVPF